MWLAYLILGALLVYSIFFREDDAWAAYQREVDRYNEESLKEYLDKYGDE